jgi:hypothetical protein
MDLPTPASGSSAERRLHEIEEGFERELGALLGSVNFSGYSDRARLRADDVAIRGFAGGKVLEAKGVVGGLIHQWRKAHIPEPTREQPFPPDDAANHLRRLQEFESRLAAIELRIRSAAAPDFDVVWNQRADGIAVLEALLKADTRLVTMARDLAMRAHDLTLDQIAADHSFHTLSPAADAVEAALRERSELLTPR